MMRGGGFGRGDVVEGDFFGLEWERLVREYASVEGRDCEVGGRAVGE